MQALVLYSEPDLRELYLLLACTLVLGVRTDSAHGSVLYQYLLSKSKTLHSNLDMLYVIYLLENSSSVVPLLPALSHEEYPVIIKQWSGVWPEMAQKEKKREGGKGGRESEGRWEYT